MVWGLKQSAVTANRGVTIMKATLNYKDDVLYIVEESNISARHPNRWLPVGRAEFAEVQMLIGRPVKVIDLSEGTYADEEGNVYQLKDKGTTNPIAVEHLAET